MTEHLLTLLVGLPLLGGLFVLCMPRQDTKLLRWFPLGVMGATFVMSLLLLTGDYNGASMQFAETASWVPALGIGYRVGVDGISLWLVLLTTLLTPVALFASWLSVSTKVKEYAAAFLFLEAAMIGTFVALDVFLFYVFWELMLVPMYLIVGIWGG
ncbi:MAG: NADH-quinone oxidoreductase subunit M, partial [Myxococcales bacterium]|nr:NADH-quinone oxidoreductase subunit M [Myxococcales bacterium]